MAPSRQNQLQTTHQACPVLQFPSAVIFATTLGTGLLVKEGLGTLSLSSAMASFSTSLLPDLLLVLSATLVCDLFSTPACPAYSGSWL